MPETGEVRPSRRPQDSPEEPDLLIEFASLYERHLPALVRYARRFVRSDATAWDIVQQVMLHVLERIWANKLVRLRAAYLFTAVEHEALRWLDHQRVVKDTAEAVAADWPVVFAPSDQLRWRETLAVDLDEAISRLSRSEEEVIERIRINGESYAEVAKAMSTKLNTTGTHYRRAIKKLRRWLAPKWRSGCEG